MIRIYKGKLDGVLLIGPEVFTDYRGDFVMLYSKGITSGMGLDFEILEQDISTSHRGVLRGLHLDPLCNKLISVVHGEIFYVVADVERCIWESFILSGRNYHQVFKPARYAGGFQALTDDVVFLYTQNNSYDPKRQSTYLWNDAKLNITWPILPPVLSERDRVGHI